MNVGGGLACAAQLRWTSAPCSADNWVTILWVRRGGMLPVGSVNSKEHCNGLGRLRTLVIRAVAGDLAGYLFKYIL